VTVPSGHHGLVDDLLSWCETKRLSRYTARNLPSQKTSTVAWRFTSGATTKATKHQARAVTRA
jgi:hypothetical protein